MRKIRLTPRKIGLSMIGITVSSIGLFFAVMFCLAMYFHHAMDMAATP